MNGSFPGPIAPISTSLRYIEYANSPHDLIEEDWEQAWNCVVRWFETFLSC